MPISEKEIVFFLNGQILRGAGERSQTDLTDGDEMTIMIFVVGG